MDPICFQIGSFEIRWYGVLAALGFLVATYLVNLNRRYARMNSDQATSLVFFAVIAGIVGARIFFVVLNFEQYRQQLWKIVRIDEGGLVFYGGFFLALMTVILYCRWHKISMVATMDVLAPALAAGDLGIAMGAIGSDIAINSASIALMNNDLRRIPMLVSLSKQLRMVINQNLLVGLLFVFGGIVLSVFGWMTPIWAALLHTFSTLLIIFNSARLVRTGEELTLEEYVPED